MAPTTRSQTRRLAAPRSFSPDTLVKALRPDFTHHGYTFRLGRNDDPTPWNPEECKAGGLYACELRHLLLWASLYPDIDRVALVRIPEDARVQRFETKLKASALELVEILPLGVALDAALASGADVHAQDDAALRCASRNGHLAVVQTLLTAGANVHAKDDYAHALRCASAKGHGAVVQALLNAGANVHADDDEALRLASMKGHGAVVQALLTAGANVHAQDESALREASANGHGAVVQALLNAGADVHAQDDEALRWASRNGHLAVVQALLTAGANVHALDDSALRWASAGGHHDVVTLLRKHL